jgi:hypothetical protein
MSDRHPLELYFERHPEITKAELARRASVSQQRMSDVLAGRVIRFAPEAAERLEAATNGELNFRELMLFRRRRPARRSSRRAS